MVTPKRDDLAELARRWVEASCEAQGVPVKVEDVATVAQVAGLLVVPAVEVA